MKLYKIVLLYTLLLLINQQAHAKGFYINPNVAAGISNMFKSRLSWAPTSPALCYSAEVHVGYKFSSFHIATGITYLKQGFEYRNITVAVQNPVAGQPSKLEPADFLSYAHQAVVPIIIGEELTISEKLSIVPEIGLAMGISIADETIMKYHSSGEKRYSRNQNGYLNAYAIASMRLLYKINDGIGITLGPRCWTEINTLVGLPTWYHKPSNVYSFMGNLGVLINL